MIILFGQWHKEGLIKNIANSNTWSFINPECQSYLLPEDECIFVELDEEVLNDPNAVLIRQIEKVDNEKVNIIDCLPDQYHDYLDLFRLSMAEKLTPRRTFDYAIYLKPDMQPPWGPIYPLSQKAGSSPKIPGRHAQTRKNLPQQISGRCTNPVCTQTGWSLKVSGGLPWLKQGYHKQQIPYPLDHGIKRSGPRRTDFYQARPEGWLSSNQNLKGRRMENCLQNALWTLLVSCHAFWLSQHSSYLPNHDEQNPMGIPRLRSSGIH